MPRRSVRILSMLKSNPTVRENDDLGDDRNAQAIEQSKDDVTPTSTTSDFSSTRAKGKVPIVILSQIVVKEADSSTSNKKTVSGNDLSSTTFAPRTSVSSHDIISTPSSSRLTHHYDDGSLSETNISTSNSEPLLLPSNDLSSAISAPSTSTLPQDYDDGSLSETNTSTRSCEPSLLPRNDLSSAICASSTSTLAQDYDDSLSEDEISKSEHTPLLLPKNSCKFRKETVSGNDLSFTISVPTSSGLVVHDHYDSLSEDKTSGSEYMPSSGSSTSLTLSEDECHLPSETPNHCNDELEPTVSTSARTKRKTQKMEHTRKLESTVFEEQLTVTSTTDLVTANHNNVFVSSATNMDGKRIRDKGHACYFCHKVVKSFARHLQLVHHNERDVASLLAQPKNSTQRKEGFGRIARAGDFYHNLDVLSVKNGELILVRRPTKNEAKLISYNDYGPCPHCLGFMLKENLWHHIKNSCLEKHTNMEIGAINRHVIAESNALLNGTFNTELSSDFVADVCSKFRDDKEGRFCKEDFMILRFGEMLFEKYGTTQLPMIRQNMRQLARLTLKLQELKKTNAGLADFLTPELFDTIIVATKSLCIAHKNIARRPEFESPSLALKIGHALIKCAAFKRASCLKAGNLSGNTILINFLELMKLEWNSKISSNALATLYNRKVNSPQLLPLTSDLIKLSLYLDTEMKKMCDKLSCCPSIKSWGSLASLTLAKIILFNKRRSGEAGRMTMFDYGNRPHWSDQNTEELKKSLTAFETKLANKLTLVEIIGKRGRKVPVLLTEDVKISIEMLINFRDHAKICKDNPYVFARSGMSVHSMRGHDCLRNACSDAGLECADRITSTKLRKYTSTVCQVFNLSETDYDWLARHLGHDIRVHREFYRLHESAVELTKVSRLLLAIDRGQVNTFKGKKLEDINIEDFSNAEDSEGEQGARHSVQAEQRQPNDAVNPEENSSSSQQTVGEIVEEIQVTKPNTKGKPSRKSTAARQRRPWSSEEKSAVLRFFKQQIKRDQIPGKVQCEKCIKEHDVLSTRSWTDVKFCIKNHLDKINKIKR